MKQFLEKLRVEDWVTVWLSIPLLLLAILVPHSVPSVPSTFVGEAAWHDILILFLIVPNPDKSFTRGASDYMLYGKQSGVASFDTPKSVGE